MVRNMFLATRYLNYPLVAIAVIALSLGMVTTSDANIDEDTIAGMWTFEEGKGKEVKDLSGNGSDGEFVGDLKWAKGKFGGGLEFNGADTWVKIGTKGEEKTLASLDFKDSDGFSIHAWVWAAEPPVGKCVIWKGLGCSTWSQYLLGTGAHENGDGKVNKASFHIRAGNGGARLETLGDELPDKEWVHLVGTWDGSKVSVYVNGKLQNSEDAKGPPWPSPEEVYIGADPGCGKRCQWNGIIDEVVVFNVTLDDDQVAKLGAGIEGALDVDAAGKMATTWGKLKSSQ